MTDVVVYGFPGSTYVRTVRLALEEKSVAHEVEPLARDGDEIKPLHPFAKIPAFRHGAMVLYETLAICAYVDAAFDGPALQPPDAGARRRRSALFLHP